MLPVLWRRYITELGVQRGVVDHTIRSYECGWTSLAHTASQHGWRLRVVEDLTHDRLLQWQQSLKEVGRKEWTCRTYLMALKGFTRWLNVNGYAKTDSGARFRTPRLKRVLPVLPPFEDFAAKITAEPDVRNRAIVAIGLYGGLRAAEIANLKIANFVPEAGLMGFVGKGGKQRSVALPKPALQVLAEYLRQYPATLPGEPLIRTVDGTNRALSYWVINRVVKRWTQRHLGVRLTPHKLRHAYGKHCVDRGVDIRIIAEALGHETLESTRIYTQVSFARVRQIAELFDSPGGQIKRTKNGNRVKGLARV